MPVVEESKYTNRVPNMYGEKRMRSGLERQLTSKSIDQLLNEEGYILQSGVLIDLNNEDEENNETAGEFNVSVLTDVKKIYEEILNYRVASRESSGGFRSNSQSYKFNFNGSQEEIKQASDEYNKTYFFERVATQWTSGQNTYLQVDMFIKDLCDTFIALINALTPGGKWLALKAWSHFNTNSAFSELPNSDILQTLRREFSIYRDVKHTVKELPTSEQYVLSISKNVPVSTEEMGELKKHDGAKYYSLIELIVHRLTELGVTRSAEVPVFASLYKDQYNPLRSWNSSKQIDTDKLLLETQRIIDMNGIAQYDEVPDWVKLKLAQNPYYSVSERPGQPEDLFALAKPWGVAPDSLPTQIAVHVGDMPLWKRMAAENAWKQVLSMIDPFDMTGDRIEYSQDINDRQKSEYVNFGDTMWVRLKTLSDDLDEYYEEYNGNRKKYKNYSWRPSEGESERRTVSNMFLYAQTSVFQLNDETEEKRIDYKGLDFERLKIYREMVEQKSDDEIVVPSQTGFQVLKRSDLLNLFGPKFNEQISKGKIEVLRQSDDKKRIMSILYPTLPYGYVQLLLQTLESSSSEYLKQKITVDVDSETGVYTKTTTPLSKFDALYGIKTGAYQNSLQFLFQNSKNYYDDSQHKLSDIDFSQPLSRSSTVEMVNNQWQINSGFKLALVFEKEWKQWIDKNLRNLYLQEEKKFDTEFILSRIGKVQLSNDEIGELSKQKKFSKQFDQTILDSYWGMYVNSLSSEELNQINNDIAGAKKQLFAKIMIHIRAIRKSQEYQDEFKTARQSYESRIVVNPQTYHDMSYWLPIAPSSALKGLDVFLLKHCNAKITDLEIISRNWPTLPDGLKKASFKEILIICKSRKYENPKHMGFAAESASWGVNESSYKNYENRFIDSLNTPVPFDTTKKWKIGDLSGFFLRRDDPRGIYLGQHTNCCQSPGGVGSACAWYGQESPNSGFFIIENSKSEIIAQSWTWVSDDGGVCFDNCEAKGLGDNQSIVLNLYQNVAQDLSHSFHTVTIGSNGDLNLTGLLSYATNDVKLDPPGDYSGYRDSKSQTLIAHNPNLPKVKMTLTDTYIRGALESDVEIMKEIAKQCYGPDAEEIPVGDMGFVMYTKNNEPAGYAILDSNNFEINDIAVVPDKRGRDSLLLINTVLKKCKSLNDVWTCNARESTSLKLLKLLEKKGTIKIIEEQQGVQNLDGEDYPFVKFVLI